jgi:sugar phosphate permease
MLSLSFLRYNARYLAFGFLLNFSSYFGQTPFIALFSGDIRAEFGLSHGDFGSLYLIATIASAMSLAVYGRLADRISLGILGMIALAGLAVMSLSMAFVGSVGVLVLVLYGLRLFGQGMTGHIAMTAMGRWYTRARGRALSFAGLGYPIGQSFFPLVTVGIVAAFGWRQAWIVGMFYLLALAPFVFWLARRDPGEEAEAALKEARDADNRPIRHWSRSEVIRDPLFYILLPAVLAPPFMMTGVFFHQVHLVESKGWSLALFASGYPVYSAFTVALSLLTGWAIDRFGSGRLLPFYLLPMATALSVLAYTDGAAGLFVFMILGGTSSGAGMSLIGSLWPELYGTRNLGSVRSVIVGGMVLASALAPGLMGWLIDAGVHIEHQLFVMSAWAYGAALLMTILSLRSPRIIAMCR